MISALVKLLSDKGMREILNNPEGAFCSENMVSNQSHRGKSNDPEDAYYLSKIHGDKAPREKSNDHEGAYYSSKMLGDKAPIAKSNYHEGTSYSLKMLGQETPRMKSNDHEDASRSLNMLGHKTPRVKSNDYEDASHSSKMLAYKTLKANSNDPGWKYATWLDLKNKRKLQCTLCGMITNRGITGQKEHLAGGFRTVDKCQLTTSEIVNEIKSWMMLKKKNLNISKVNSYEDDDAFSSTDDTSINHAFFKRRKSNDYEDAFHSSEMLAYKKLKANSNDPGWKYAIWLDLKKKRKLQCTLCGMITNRGITGQKEHLVGGFRTVEKCQLTTPEIVNEIKSWMMLKKKNLVVNCYDDDAFSSTDDTSINHEFFQRRKRQKSVEGYEVLTVDDNFTVEEGKVDDKCTSFIYENNLPISIVKNSSFVDFLGAAQQHDGVYTPQSVNELHTTIHKRRGGWKEEARKKKDT